MQIAKVSLLLCFVVNLGASSAFAISYVFTPVDVPGSNFTVAFGINDSAQIVGTFGSQHGFLKSGNSIINIDFPGASSTTPLDINNAGQIVGSYVSDSTFHGFLRDADGTFSTIDAPGPSSFFNQAFGINDVGQIVGRGPQGFLRDPSGVFTNFEVAGSIITTPQSINNGGQIVGSFVEDAPPFNPTHAFFRGTDGIISIIDVPDAFLNQASAEGINDIGQIVLNSVAGNFVREPNGTFSVIAVPNAIDFGVRGINNAGQIVGLFSDSTGTHGFLGTPIPEPATWLLLCSGLIGVVLWRRRQLMGNLR